MSDAKVIFLIVTIFIIVGTFLPFVNDEFGESSSTSNVDELISDVGDDTGGAVKILLVPLTIVKMFFWHFGNLPFWLNSIFWIMRIILAYTIYKHIRGVGS